MIELSSKQLRRAADLKDKIQSLQNELSRLLRADLVGNGSPAKAPTLKKRKMSAESRAKISAAATARWAKVKAGKK